MYLTKEQQIFVVKKYFEPGSYAAVINFFRWQFPDRNPPSNSSMQRVKKNSEHGEIQNRKKKNSGRRIPIQTYAVYRCDTVCKRERNEEGAMLKVL